MQRFPRGLSWLMCPYVRMVWNGMAIKFFLFSSPRSYLSYKQRSDIHSSLHWWLWLDTAAFIFACPSADLRHEDRGLHVQKYDFENKSFFDRFDEFSCHQTRQHTFFEFPERVIGNMLDIRIKTENIFLPLHEPFRLKADAWCLIVIWSQYAKRVSDTFPSSLTRTIQQSPCFSEWNINIRASTSRDAW